MITPKLLAGARVFVLGHKVTGKAFEAVYLQLNVVVLAVKIHHSISKSASTLVKLL
jgi:hypothetical protein